MEKSELWVYKSKSEGSKKDDGDDDDSEKVCNILWKAMAFYHLT